MISEIAGADNRKIKWKALIGNSCLMLPALLKIQASLLFCKTEV